MNPEERIDGLAAQLEQLRDEAYAAAQADPPDDGWPGSRRPSVRNLRAYLALRRHDLRDLQAGLSALGLATLDQAEPQVLATLDAAVDNLRLRRGLPPNHATNPGAADGWAMLEANTERLFGPAGAGRRARIMVTLPDQAADDPLLLQELLKSGMNCARINCAYGDQPGWLRAIETLREAQQVTGRDCLLFMDLRGPKLRTGAMAPEPTVLKVRPQRAVDGRVLRPARVWFHAAPDAGPERAVADAAVRVDGQWLARLKAGDRVRLRDARGAGRNWKIVEVGGAGCWAECRKTSYLANGLRLRRKRRSPEGELPECVLDSLPPRESVTVIRRGDMLYLENSAAPGTPAVHDLGGELLRPARIPLPVPEIFRDVRPGDPIGFDDGHVVGVIEEAGASELRVRVTHTRRPRETLGGSKGVNLPDTALGVPALGEDDLADLPFVAQHADLVGLSFTQTAEDVRSLQRRLGELGAAERGVVFKIETRLGCRNLPEILLEALRLPASGIMIARGDLAAECGFEALAGLQEDLLRLGAAAHLPVTWATGVLDRLARSGQPERAEITDAAAAQRAECVLLGKGRQVARAVRVLDRILRDAADRDYKLRRWLPALRLGG